MYRDEYRLVTSTDDDDPCLSVEMVRHHAAADKDVADAKAAGPHAGSDSGSESGPVRDKVERVPVAGEIVPLNGHGYCASVARCRPATTGPNGQSRRIVWNEQIDEVFDNLETCRIAIENAFEPDEFLG